MVGTSINLRRIKKTEISDNLKPRLVPAPPPLLWLRDFHSIDSAQKDSVPSIQKSHRLSCLRSEQTTGKHSAIVASAPNTEIFLLRAELNQKMLHNGIILWIESITEANLPENRQDSIKNSAYLHANLHRDMLNHITYQTMTTTHFSGCHSAIETIA